MTQESHNNTHCPTCNEEMENVDQTQDVQESADTEELSEVDALKQQLEMTGAEVEKHKQEYLFLMAEFDNFRKRTMREKSDIIKNAAEGVLKGLLPIVDDFERGIEAVTKAGDADDVVKGMELIYQKFIKYLAQNGVKPIESTGKPFDSELHEAIAMVPVGDQEDKKGIVIDTPTKGYTINDKVLRHAKVVVGQ